MSLGVQKTLNEPGCAPGEPFPSSGARARAAQVSHTRARPLEPASCVRSRPTRRSSHAVRLPQPHRTPMLPFTLWFAHGLQTQERAICHRSHSEMQNGHNTFMIMGSTLPKEDSWDTRSALSPVFPSDLQPRRCHACRATLAGTRGRGKRHMQGGVGASRKHNKNPALSFTYLQSL